MIDPHTSPCLGCSNRVLYCHGSCERYREYQQMCETLRQRWAKETGAATIEYIRSKLACAKGRPGKEGVIGFSNRQR